MTEESRDFAERILRDAGWDKHPTKDVRESHEAFIDRMRRDTGWDARPTEAEWLAERFQLRPLSEFRRQAVEMLRPGFMIPRGGSA